MTEWFNTAGLEHLLAEYGYGLVFLVIGLEAMGVPCPGESLIIIASVYCATTGKLSIWGVLPAAMAGAVMGDNFGYLIGRRLGVPALRRFGRHVGLTEARLNLGRYLFRQYGGRVVFLGRFIAILRTFVALLAGASGMDWRVFLLWNAVGGVVWSLVYGLGGYLLGAAMERVAGPIGIAIAVLAAIALVCGIVFLRRNEARLEARASAAMREADGQP